MDSDNPHKVSKLVLGGCRSGKSSYAQNWVRDNFDKKVFVATLRPGDDREMLERVEFHQQSRGEGWQLIEAPYDLASVLRDTPEDSSSVLLIDCITMWLTNNLLLETGGKDLEEKIRELCGLIAACRKSVVLVANEVGLGIAPDNYLGRHFRDVAGWTNQKLAEVCREVFFVAAGCSLKLK
ncbi:MAG: bifunctional adenosylcobinamide kinase/adenosylcobinamide-phosphate guanylyltransferase [Desulfurivibrionaceae bacterium]